MVRSMLLIRKKGENTYDYKKFTSHADAAKAFMAWYAQHQTENPGHFVFGPERWTSHPAHSRIPNWCAQCSTELLILTINVPRGELREIEIVKTHKKED